MFGGLGGHASVLFSLADASQGEAAHSVAFVSRGPLLDAHAVECRRRGIPFAHFRTAGGFDRRFHAAVFAWLLRERPDAIFVHSSGSLPTALLIRALGRTKKVVAIEHQSWLLRGPRHAWSTTLSLLFADHCVVLSADYRRRLERRFGLLARRGGVSTIPNGVDVDRYSPAASEERPGQPLRIGMQSRLTPIKDHPTLLRAVTEIRRRGGPDVVLELAGQGTMRASLERLANELGIAESVRFLGPLGGQELVAFLRRLDIYVHASLGETMSTALMQALAVGLPIVASDVPGVGDLAQGTEVMRLVPPRNPRALAQALIELAEDAADRRRMAASARKLAVRSLSNVRMWHAYRELLEGPKLAQALDQRVLPLWRVLGDRMRDDGRRESAVVCLLDGGGERWEAAVSRGGAAVRSGGRLILAFDRKMAKTLVALRKGRLPPRARIPSQARALAFLVGLGLRPERSYAVWPSVVAPRIAFPMGSRLATHLRRSGVLAGGGATIWGRLVERSPVFDAIAMRLAPGYAVVASVVKGPGG
jgi:glycosyltransferase involved in cell wall biosynthesis